MKMTIFKVQELNCKCPKVDLDQGIMVEDHMRSIGWDYKTNDENLSKKRLKLDKGATLGTKLTTGKFKKCDCNPLRFLQS